MNKILNEIKKIISQNMSKYLSDVKPGDLEENGKVYYMNGKNGTEFDWYVNQHISDFMMFYNDENNLGAVKLTLYHDGKISLYLYEEKGTKLRKEVITHIDTEKTDIAKFAVVLKNMADDNGIWDADIDSINIDEDVTEEMQEEFKNNKKYYEGMINKMKILNLNSYVSKKIVEDGWKAGFMERGEPVNDKDSGWAFMAGDEDDAYLSDAKNIVLVSVGHVWQQFDPDIFKYIDSPIGTKLIRISPNEFEIDNKNKKIFMEKR